MCLVIPALLGARRHCVKSDYIHKKVWEITDLNKSKQNSLELLRAFNVVLLQITVIAIIKRLWVPFIMSLSNWERRKTPRKLFWNLKIMCEPVHKYKQITLNPYFLQLLHKDKHSSILLCFWHFSNLLMCLSVTKCLYALYCVALCCEATFLPS